MSVSNIKVQNQLKSAQSQVQARQSQIQQIQRELQQAKEALQQNLTNQKELQQSQQTSQQSHNQEVTRLQAALSQAENKVRSILFVSLVFRTHMLSVLICSCFFLLFCFDINKFISSESAVGCLK